MSKRKNKVQTISVMSGLEATIMPKFNTHAVGYGKWASRKDKQRKAERKQISLLADLTAAIKMIKRSRQLMYCRFWRGFFFLCT